MCAERVGGSHDHRVTDFLALPPLLASDPFGGGMHSTAPPQPSVTQSLMDSPYGGEAGPAGPLKAQTAAPPALNPSVAMHEPVLSPSRSHTHTYTHTPR